MKLQKLEISCFLGKSFFGDDGFQNMFVNKPTLDTLELNEGKKTHYVID